MAADAALAPAAVRAVRNPLSLVRVESAMARSAAAVGLVFFAQSWPVLSAQLDRSRPVWTGVVIALVVAALVFAVVASVLGRLVTVAMLSFSVVYLGIVLSWPFAVVHPSFDSPWFYYLMTVATATAAMSLSAPSATVYLIAVPTLYAVIRLTAAGGTVPPLVAAFNSVYSIILGGAVLVIVTMLRSAAAQVDTAQDTALIRYASVVRQHATEAERVRVDAIVHDSVLTTLISAARAGSPETQRLAGSMASAAIVHLREAALATPDDGSTVRLAIVADGIRAAIRQLPASFQISETRLGPRAIPAVAGEAMHAAAVQAAVNSVNHAGPDVRRTLRFSDADGAFEVEVSDDGRGFDPARVPRERLGVRVSIVERLANVGGRAIIRTAPGEGTTVGLHWPAGPSAADPDSGAEAAS